MGGANMTNQPPQTDPSQTGSIQSAPSQTGAASPSQDGTGAGTGTGTGGMPPEILSARTQASTANFIVGGLIFISVACITCAFFFASNIPGGDNPRLALVGGAITGLISIVSAAVGGLVNSLVAPSGVAAVVAAAQKHGASNNPPPPGG
ncbi:MAG TPA: hypothetical protein VGF50_01595 [Caulobacteraceae bacterium]